MSLGRWLKSIAVICASSARSACQCLLCVFSIDIQVRLDVPPKVGFNLQPCVPDLWPHKGTNKEMMFKLLAAVDTRQSSPTEACDARGEAGVESVTRR